MRASWSGGLMGLQAGTRGAGLGRVAKGRKRRVRRGAQRGGGRRWRECRAGMRERSRCVHWETGRLGQPLASTRCAPSTRRRPPLAGPRPGPAQGPGPFPALSSPVRAPLPRRLSGAGRAVLARRRGRLHRARGGALRGGPRGGRGRLRGGGGGGRGPGGHGRVALLCQWRG
jgi:hypothetical protein